MTKKVKAKPTKCNFTVWIELYKTHIVVSLGETDQEIQARMTKNATSQELKELILGPTSMAYCYHFDDRSELIRFRDYPVTNDHFAALAHEISHAANSILDQAGLKLSGNSEEAWCYLIEFITSKIYEQINPFG